MGVVDGRTLANWRRLRGEAALAHQRPGNDLSVRLGALAGADLCPYTPPPMKNSSATSWSSSARAPSRSSTTAWPALAKRRPGFTISMDELVNVSGPRPHNEIERRERRVV